MRHLGSIAGLLVVLVLASACGNDEPPKDASPEDFCAAIAIQDSKSSSYLSDHPAAYVELLKQMNAKLREVGTPSDASPEVRAAFEKSLKYVDDLPDDASYDDAHPSDEQSRELAPLADYIGKTCNR